MNRLTIVTNTTVPILSIACLRIKANPIPWPPPAAMPLEDMKVVIWQTVDA